MSNNLFSSLIWKLEDYIFSVITMTIWGRGRDIMDKIMLVILEVVTVCACIMIFGSIDSNKIEYMYKYRYFQVWSLWYVIYALAHDEKPCPTHESSNSLTNTINSLDLYTDPEDDQTFIWSKTMRMLLSDRIIMKLNLIAWSIQK